LPANDNVIADGNSPAVVRGLPFRRRDIGRHIADPKASTVSAATLRADKRYCSIARLSLRRLVNHRG
jgi:hypothetical protein